MTKMQIRAKDCFRFYSWVVANSCQMESTRSGHILCRQSLINIYPAYRTPGGATEELLMRQTRSWILMVCERRNTRKVSLNSTFRNTILLAQLSAIHGYVIKFPLQAIGQESKFLYSKTRLIVKQWAPIIIQSNINKSSFLTKHDLYFRLINKMSYYTVSILL